MGLSRYAFRRNEYLDTAWALWHKVIREHFHHVGAKEENRNPVCEALLANYPIGDDEFQEETVQRTFTL